MSPRDPPAKKRKIDDATASSSSTAPPVKKSPLAGLPQNYYAPPNVSMTREELAAWRKEQRRERNRQSAAESRNKTKVKIAELEGEVHKYKSLCESMKVKMERMEEQIRLLTASAEMNMGERCLLRPSVSMEHQPQATTTITPPASYPNSPSRSPVPHESNGQFPFFPPLLSAPADCAPFQVTSRPDVTADTSVASLKNKVSSSIESKEHLIKPISRQA